MTKIYQYKELGGLTSFLCLLLGLGVLSGLVSAGSSLMQLVMLSGPFTNAEATLNDQRELVLSLASLALFLVTAIVFGVWIVRAHKNTHAMGAQRLEYTPGWALGWFFVPIMNFFKPYQAMSQLWQASHNPSNWTHQPVGGIVHMWWGAWILNGVAGQVANSAGRRADTLEELTTATIYVLGGEFVGVAACVIAMMLVLRISKAQKAPAPIDPHMGMGATWGMPGQMPFPQGPYQPPSNPYQSPETR